MNLRRRSPRPEASSPEGASGAARGAHHAEPEARVALARLQGARSRRELIHTLEHDLGLELGELALLAGVDTATIAQWDQGENPPTAERLDDLGDIAVQLIGNGKLGPLRATGWLRSRNRLLGGHRPLDVLRCQGYRSVIPAVDAVR